MLYYIYTGGVLMYLTVREVAEMLQLNEVTIRRYIGEGKIKAYKFGRNYRIEKEELDRFLETKSSIK